MTVRSVRADTEHIPCVIILDHHPADSRTEIAEDQKTIQTLTSRMGTGGGNVPMILEPYTLEKERLRKEDMCELNKTETHSIAYTLKVRGGGRHLYEIKRQERNSWERSVDTD